MLFLYSFYYEVKLSHRFLFESRTCSRETFLNDGAQLQNISPVLKQLYIIRMVHPHVLIYSVFITFTQSTQFTPKSACFSVMIDVGMNCVIIAQHLAVA
ncbi:unnamed protein product [Haemonchus placei]|uniref:7TM_GPCR_Srx domain-containing protein n=1 Tax=Haemonchus placei TaxID=6290 RepID=A0A0N4VSB5_HAEPC|nr:unnamed protein product [Haemonchus placei]